MKNLGKRLSVLLTTIIVLVTGGLNMGIITSGASYWDTYSDTWVLTDALGRTTPDIKDTGSVKEDKYVAIFYHIWHRDFMNATVNSDSKAPRNISQIIANNEDALTNKKYWGGNASYHYWGEPLFGYYDLAEDDYVVRKHAQMLTDIGVDAIIIDYSNYCVGGVHTASGYMEKSLRNVLDTYLEIRAEGGDTPQVVLLLTWSASDNVPAIKRFYSDFYSDDKYKDLWFNWEGKPLILAQDTALKNDIDVPEEVVNFFTYRKPHPFYTPVTEPNAWAWLSNYPQVPGYTEDDPCEIVAVGVAQNWSTSLDFMTAVNDQGQFICQGRSWTYGGNNKLLTDPTSSEYGSEYGANLQQQFDRAIELDPKILFVTGWNEWIAGRFTEYPDWAASSKTDNMLASGGFCDVFSTEFSRDAEPTREGNLGDNFYNQLAINIRKFKGTGTQNAKSQKQTIDLTGSFSQWDNISLEFRDDMNDISIRDAKGIGKNNYTNDTGRNDFKISKVTYDDNNLYFYVETVADITPYTDSNWMNLCIEVSSSEPSWEGFNYIVNRSNVREGLTTLEKSTGGWNWTTVSENISYVVSGNKMMLTIPKADLGLSDPKNIDINFKWMDNTCSTGDYLEFYENGDCAPNGRFCYNFTNIEKAPLKTKTAGVPLAVKIALGAAIAILAGSIVFFLKGNKKK